VIDLLAYMGVFNIQIKITGNDVVNADLPGLCGFYSSSKAVLLVAPPVVLGF
jgi:hypothetical protein